MYIPERTEWNKLSRSKQVSIARELGKQLPASFAFVDVREQSIGEITQQVAVFSHESNAVFAFIPGGEISLGFEVSHWHPNEDEQESWLGTAEEYGIENSLIEHIAKATTPRRLVELPPFFIETTATEVGWKQADLDDPDVKELIAGLPRGKGKYTTSMSRGDRAVRVTRCEHGILKAEIALKATHESLSAEMLKKGFRFPTSDEWEYACGSGSETLFRWGDHVPCDRYPTDMNQEEAFCRRDRVLSGGNLENPPKGFESDWNYHRQPNAFGLKIAEDPYKCELTAEPNITRGGDGGCTICGGAGFFVGWLTLATAFFEPYACNIDPEHGVTFGSTIGRRVITLP